MSATDFTTVSGIQIDLFDPRAEHVSFNDVAEQLAKATRYGGATPNTVYSVAEHSVRGADFIARTSKRAAAYFLCHDFHEAYLGDDTTPKKRTLDRVATEEFATLADAVTKSYAAVVDRFDAAIHQAAELRWPPQDEIASIVHAVDRGILVTEWRELRPEHPLPPGYENAQPLPIKIEPWGWQRAREELLARMHALLPVFQRGEG